MIILAMMSNSFWGRMLAMAYGVMFSLALPLETIMLPLFVSDVFDEKSYNKILGILVAVNTATTLSVCR